MKIEICTINPNEEDREALEISAFVASILLGGAEHEPITTETAFNCIVNWLHDGIELPKGITAARLANEWNKQVNAYC